MAVVNRAMAVVNRAKAVAVVPCRRRVVRIEISYAASAARAKLARNTK